MRRLRRAGTVPAVSGDGLQARNAVEINLNHSGPARVLKSMKVALLMACVVCPVVAQTSLRFEVASVKPYVSSGNPAGDSSDTNVLPGGRFTGTNVTVRKLIRNAFQVEDSRILGAPGWIDLQSYNIEAKTADGLEITRDNISQLMLALLETRFRFQYRRERQETPEYALEVAKGGIKMKPDTGDGKPSMSTNNRSGMVTLKATKLSLPDFAASLARQTGRPVVDKTGLGGDFDFDLTWSADQAPDSGATSIFTVLQGLGLRLVSTKGLVDVIAIDRVEKASEN